VNFEVTARYHNATTNTKSGFVYVQSSYVHTLQFPNNPGKPIQRVKISAIMLRGFTFYKAAGAISNPTTSDWHFTRRFSDGGYSLTFVALSAVATGMIQLSQFS